jgi:hypothetical protein
MINFKLLNEEESAASFCRQMAAWFADMFGNFYIVTNSKNSKKLITTRAGENKHKFGFLNVCLTKFLKHIIFLNKIADNHALKWVIEPHWTTK